ncbi:hypothetical protein B9J78_00985 [bacterium Unc6]|nr:hypothetical protein [bacterium Unc6]
MNILVTGANGFVGQALCKRMLVDGYQVRGAVRAVTQMTALPSGVEGAMVGDISPETDWSEALDGIDAVVHLAARVHVMDDTAADPLAAFREVNVLGTERLARMAAKYGVRRLIFISSIGVNGEFSSEMPFSEKNLPNPHNAYAVSKWEAEQVLHVVSKNSGMEVVILRPPLVYGPDAPGNFARLMRVIKTGLPLPFGNIKSLRSFVYIDNLIDAIITCVTHPLAAGETFMVSDGQDVSTPDLIKMIASAMNKKVILFSLHPGILKSLCKIAGKGEEMEKLTGSLLVDSSKIRNLLGWKPPFTLEEGIKETVKYYES